MKPTVITVMSGGPSAEREVSLRTGQAVTQALRARGHRVFELDPKPSSWVLAPETEVVFLALHGTYGEDGVIQGELDALGIPYTGCGQAASQLAFDKVKTKKVCSAAGVRTPQWLVFRSVVPLPAEWCPPLVLKPAKQGSSVGLEFVNTVEEFMPALARALRYDDSVLCEQKIIGRELTAGLLGTAVLPIVEIRPKQGAYDYHNKYTAGATEYFCPAPLCPNATEETKRAALTAFQAAGCRDYARIDFMLDDQKQPWLLEINTLPGMTATSLLPKAAAAAGISYEDLCERMIELALARQDCCSSGGHRL